VLPWLARHGADLILLDLMLPAVPGEKVCADLRAAGHLMPIIIITAKVGEEERILGLELGADDYMCKPLSPREVVARVKAALRRHGPPATGAAAQVLLNQGRLQISFNGNSVQVTGIEFQLIKILLQNPGHIYSREYLISNLYPDNRVVHDRTVDGHVKKLRRKLKPLFGEWETISSVYGMGYQFLPPPDSSSG
jgi:two-component system response regulator BaeR